MENRKLVLFKILIYLASIVSMFFALFVCLPYIYLHIMIFPDVPQQDKNYYIAKMVINILLFLGTAIGAIFMFKIGKLKEKN